MKRVGQGIEPLETIPVTNDPNLRIAQALVRPTPTDLALSARLVNQAMASDNEALRHLADEAQEHYRANADTPWGEQYYQASKLILAMLYVNGDPSVPDAPAVPVAAFDLLREQ